MVLLLEVPRFHLTPLPLGVVTSFRSLGIGFSTVHIGILDQRDGIDGLTDGIFESPDMCQCSSRYPICADGKTEKMLDN